MSTTSFEDLINGFRAGVDGPMTIDAPETWAQGRTLYGGLSAALCHILATGAVEIDKPLKSAVVAFVGPSSGRLSGEATLLRQGKSTIVMDTTLNGEKGVGTKSLFVYGDDRESKVSQSLLPCPEVAAPEDCELFWGDRKPANFARNFELRRAGAFAPMSGSPHGEMLTWVRHATPTGSDQTAALLALADVLPPPVFTMMTEGAPISTVTWSVEVLQSNIDVRDNWFLMRSLAEHTENGYSSQAMYVWDREGRPVIAARQNVTLFY